MKERQVILPIHRRPNPFTTLIRAACGISTNFNMDTNTPTIKAVWDNAEINPAHLNRYGEICGLPFYSKFLFGAPIERQFVYPLYPLTLVFPLLMRVLGHKKAPLTVFRTLNTKLEVTAHRRIGVHEPLRVSSETASLRVVPKGLEYDIHSVVESKNETVWESIHTFYYRGNFGKTENTSANQTAISAISAPDLLSSWHLGDGIGFRFGLISGDTNGIHYNAWYARRLGFDRDLAQPILVLTKCLDSLLDGDPPAFRLTALLKGPVYYHNNVYLRGTVGVDGKRFDVYCEDNPKPSLCCELTY